MQEHHRFLLRLALDRHAALEADLGRLDAYIDEKLEPYRAAQQALTEVPGIGAQTAATIVSEVGADVSAFPSAKHLAAWAGVCPGNYESAGKRASGRVRKGNGHLRQALVEAAQSAVRTKGSYLKAKFLRLKARRGAKRAVVAIAHKLLLAVYHILQKGVGYAELGEGYLDTLTPRRTTQGLVRRLEAMGYRVALERTATEGAPLGAPP